MMMLIEFPSIVDKYAVEFESCFSAEGYKHFKKALSGFILSENKTLEAINRMFTLEKRNQSSFNRFFNRQNFDLGQINQRRLDMLQKHTNTCFSQERGKADKQKGVLSVDNSLLKHYGKHFDNIYRLYDHVDDCYRWSHDLVTLYYSDDQTDYPVYYKLWEPPDWEAVANFLKDKGFTINQDKWDNREEESQKWRNYIRARYKAGRKKHPEVKSIYKTKIHIAEQLIRDFCAQYPELIFPITMDNGYTSAELCEVISQELNRDYVGALREDQCIIQAGNNEVLLKDFVAKLKQEHFDKQTKSVFQKTGFQYKGKKQIVYAYVANHRIKGFKKKQRLVISFLKKKLSERPYYTITNRLNWYPSDILRIRRHRWPVETYHQEGKAEGLEKYQVRNDKAIQTYIAFIVVAYSMLKCTIHDENLLTKIQQRLQKETDLTLPFLRRLMKAEALVVLIQHILTLNYQEYPLEKILQAITQTIAYS